MRIVHPETGVQLEPGQRGEICVKGATFMKGYIKRDPVTYLDADGFFHTQDGGYLDADGCLVWEGRLGNVIKTGGANVSPLEIDAALAGYPGLAHRVRVGVPHATLGEAIVLCAVRAESAEVGASELRAHLRRRLAAYKVPRHVLWLERTEITFTGSAKVQIAPLRELAIAKLRDARVEIAGERYGC